jgi:hypothetical protein
MPATIDPHLSQLWANFEPNSSQLEFLANALRTKYLRPFTSHSARSRIRIVGSQTCSKFQLQSICGRKHFGQIGRKPIVAKFEPNLSQFEPNLSQTWFARECTKYKMVYAPWAFIHPERTSFSNRTSPRTDIYNRTHSLIHSIRQSITTQNQQSRTVQLPGF